MGLFKIGIALSVVSIEKSIRELRAYRQSIIEKSEELRNRVGKRVADLAQSGFNGSFVDDLLKGGMRNADVMVTIDKRSNVTVVIANGEDAVWVEFGAGVRHNTSAGSSPHPEGQNLGFTIGSFGKGLGKRDTWGFYQDGVLTFTHGTPASMPMHKAMVTVCGEVFAIAKEVFR